MASSLILWSNDFFVSGIRGGVAASVVELSGETWAMTVLPRTLARLSVTVVWEFSALEATASVVLEAVTIVEPPLTVDSDADEPDVIIEADDDDDDKTGFSVVEAEVDVEDEAAAAAAAKAAAVACCSRSNFSSRASSFASRIAFSTGVSGLICGGGIGADGEEEDAKPGGTFLVIVDDDKALEMEAFFEAVSDKKDFEINKREESSNDDDDDDDNDNANTDAAGANANACDRGR